MMNDLSDFYSDDEDLEHAVHWSKATPRQQAIIDAREAFGVEPDGYLHWFKCSYCESRWGIRQRYINQNLPGKCPECESNSVEFTDTWYPLYLLEENLVDG